MNLALVAKFIDGVDDRLVSTLRKIKKKKKHFFIEIGYHELVLLTVLMLLKSVATSDSGTVPLKGVHAIQLLLYITLSDSRLR